MNWETLQNELPPLLTNLLGIPCDFRTQPAPHRDVVARAWVDVLDIVGLGVDDRRTIDVDADGEPTSVPEDVEGVREKVEGIRESTFQITVQSLSQLLHQSARFYLERLRTRLRWTSTIESLKALGLALVRIESVLQLDTPTDMRAYSMASVDVRFAFGESDTDATAPFIERARFRSASITNAAGVPVHDSLQVDVTVPPEEEP
jgi:hypothetical protein